jgi:hypothetical protein
MPSHDSKMDAGIQKKTIQTNRDTHRGRYVEEQPACKRTTNRCTRQRQKERERASLPISNGKRCTSSTHKQVQTVQTVQCKQRGQHTPTPISIQYTNIKKEESKKTKKEQREKMIHVDRKITRELDAREYQWYKTWCRGRSGT